MSVEHEAQLLLMAPGQRREALSEVLKDVGRVREADTPAGVRIDNVHQQGASVLIQGVALSQERVADFLRLLAAGHGWLEKPELIEIHSAVQNVGGDTQTVSAFQLRVTLRKPAPPTPAASAPPKGH